MTKHDLNLCEKSRILYDHVQQTGGSKQLCFNVRGAFEIELAVEKLKSHKSPGIDQIPAE